MTQITIEDRRGKVELPKDMPPIKRAIISKLWNYLNNRADSDMWHRYTGDFKYDGETYTVQVEVRLDNVMLTYRHMHIEHKQVIIEIPEGADVDAVLAGYKRKGLIK